MNIKSPAEWTDDLAAHWQSLSKLTRRLIVFCVALHFVLIFSLWLNTSAHAACVSWRGGDVEGALHNCALAKPRCLRGVYHSAATLELINGSPVSPGARFYFHKSSWQRDPGSNPIPDPEGNAMLWSGYDRVRGLSGELRRRHALDSERGAMLTGAQLIQMGIAKACR